MFNLDILTAFVLTVGLLNTLLGLAVLWRGGKDAVNKVFGIMTLLVGIWSFAAFFFRIFTDIHTAKILGFVLYAAAALLPSIFCMMAMAFPERSWLSRRVVVWMTLETIAIIIFSVIPGTVITGLSVRSGEKILSWGVYYPIYGLHQFAFFTIGYGALLYKYFRASGQVRRQVLYIILGTIIPANLALTSNLILPWFGIYDYYTWFGQVCMIFIVLFSGYAIWKYQLFDIKVIATELLIVATVSTLFIRFLVAEEPAEKVINGVIFVIMLFFGFFIIRSVWREVAQREKLQSLSGQLEQANSQLQALDQARADFITLVSHQLRTPPTTTKWYLAAIKSGDYGKFDDEVKAAITKTELANNSLISLIDDLLNASRIERGKLEFLFEMVALDELVKFTADQLMPQAQMKGLQLVYEAPTVPVPQVQADKEKIRQVVNNFIDNAIKYTPKGSVSARLTLDENYVGVEVADTGKGIEPGVGETLFQKYSRGKDAVSHSTGIGIGLYVAKIVIENHNGIIGATSPGVGLGSVFYFKLPIHNNLPKTKTMDLVAEQGKT